MERLIFVYTLLNVLEIRAIMNRSSVTSFEIKYNAGVNWSYTNSPACT